MLKLLKRWFKKKEPKELTLSDGDTFERQQYAANSFHETGKLVPGHTENLPEEPDLIDDIVGIAETVIIADAVSDLISGDTNSSDNSSDGFIGGGGESGGAGADGDW